MKIFRAQTPLWDDSVWLLIGDADYAGKMTGYVESMTVREHKPGELIQEPSLRLGRDEAASLMDALWQAGVRPSSGEGNAGQLGATEKHLEDMRRLVFESRPAQFTERSDK